ncbi:hypothetical protein JB92DRAFT_2836496 [Gautieria morchelliformis]|nr:hypothetical protein JB92DRAFT_2836496 [Gautieria morchelliformis]
MERQRRGDQVVWCIPAFALRVFELPSFEEIFAPTALDVEETMYVVIYIIVHVSEGNLDEHDVDGFLAVKSIQQMYNFFSSLVGDLERVLSNRVGNLEERDADGELRECQSSSDELTTPFPFPFVEAERGGGPTGPSRTFLRL